MVVAILVMMILFSSSSSYYYYFIIIIIIGPSLTLHLHLVHPSSGGGTHSAQFAEALEEDIDERFLKYQTKKRTAARP